MAVLHSPSMMRAVMRSICPAGEGETLIEDIVKRLGRIDAVIHNAGFVRDKTLRKMSNEQWDDVLAVHLTASFRLSRAVWPILKIKVGAGLCLSPCIWTLWQLWTS